MTTTRDVLLARLSEIGCTPADLMEALPPQVHHAVVLIYTSHLEGLGTEHSDVDCYVITEQSVDVGLQESAGNRLWRTTIGTAAMDVEFHTPSHVRGVYACLQDREGPEGANPFGVQLGILKLLHKWQLAVPIAGSGQWAALGGGTIADRSLNRALAAHYLFAADEIYDDAVTFLEVGDWESAMVHGHQALVPAVLAYLASRGVRVVKQKWLWRRLVQALGSDHEITCAVRRFLWEGQSRESAAAEAESLLVFCQHLMTQSQV